MNCCENMKMRCINTRRKESYRYRRYKCDNCGYKYSSAEFIFDNDDSKGNRLKAIIDLFEGIKQMPEEGYQLTKFLVERFNKKEI